MAPGRAEPLWAEDPAGTNTGLTGYTRPVSGGRKFYGHRRWHTFRTYEVASLIGAGGMREGSL
jgi:hypothetical protein